MNPLVKYENTNLWFTVISKLLKDTVNNAASLNVSVLGKVELDELAKTTGVIVVHGLSVPKGLHDGTANKRKQSSQPNPCKGHLLITVNFYPYAQPTIKSHTNIFLKFCKYIELFAYNNNHKSQKGDNFFKTAMQI